MKNKTCFWLILLTPLLFLITHAIAYLVHEYAHSFTAWAFGFKANPFDLHYGNPTWANILFLQEVSEKVDYANFSSQHPWKAAFISFAGFGIGNSLLFLICCYLLITKVLNRPLYIYFFLWLAVMNLGNFLAYIPSRTFANRDDVYQIVSFLQISPWVVMILLGYPIIYAVNYFYRRVLPKTYACLGAPKLFQATTLILVTFTLFILYGTVGIRSYGAYSSLLSQLSIYLAPMIVVAYWPRISQST